MTILASLQRLRSACVVFFGPHGAVARQAHRQGCSRQALYRDAEQALQSVDGSKQQSQLAHVQQQLAQTQAQLHQLQERLKHAVEVSPDQHAEFAATAQAIGVSLTQAHTLLAIVLRTATPAVATLGRFAQQAGRRAGAMLAVLDASSRTQAEHIAADEIFSGRRPILMTLEQDSLCWLSGRLATTRDSQAWAQEFRALPRAVQVTADGARGIRKGLAHVNRERHRGGQARIRDQRDHFHGLQRARRAVRHAQAQAARALRSVEPLQKAYDQQFHAGVPRSPAQGRQLNRAWQRAEQAFDRWSAQEKAFERLRRGLRLFTSEGLLNTQAAAAATVQEALCGQPGVEWARARRLLGAEALTFLEPLPAQLAALPVAPALVHAALRSEGLRRRPEAWAGDSQRARALRGVLLVNDVLLARAGDEGQQAVQLVRGLLRTVWRASSLVETLNSVVRMQQRRQKRLTQGLLDLQRLYWNTHAFRAGKRKGSSPYGRLGLRLPEGSWWGLLQRPPEQLRQEVLAFNAPASTEPKPQDMSTRQVAA